MGGVEGVVFVDTRHDRLAHYRRESENHVKNTFGTYTTVLFLR